MKKLGILLITLTLSFLLTGCSRKDERVEEQVDLLGINFNIEGNESTLDFDTENPLVALYIENYGAVVIELFPRVAPSTVNNFITLVQEGFYDDNTFHRLVRGFVLQGGDPTGTGMGGAEYNIRGEFESNGFTNDLGHNRGVVSMARSFDLDSASSQFFIMLGDANSLNGDYAAFGRVIAGMHNVDRIERNERVADQDSGNLENNLTLRKALVDLNGFTVGEIDRVRR